MGVLPNTVPLLFGELFTTVLYDGIAIDPGSPKMRRSLARHLRQVKPKITKVVATHAHEEHVGNLNWLSELTGAPIYVSEMTARFLTPFKKLPWVRATIIGQPPNLKQPYHLLGETIDTESGHLQVIPTPGHCDDHIVLYDPKEKVLLAGDAFMGSYFATPNPDVDSRKWLVSLERLMELDIEILVEGHGHIHTLRADIPDFPGVVIREDPKVAISQKLDYLRWLREQIEAGFQEGLPVRVIEASCFPWGSRTSWESCATDECIRLLSLGHFSRTELVRSFVRTDGDQLPTVYEMSHVGRRVTSLPRSETKEIESAEVVQGSPWIGWLPISVLPLMAVACRNLLPLGCSCGFCRSPSSQPKVADMVEGAITNCSFVLGAQQPIFWLGREWMQRLSWMRVSAYRRQRP